MLASTRTGKYVIACTILLMKSNSIALPHRIRQLKKLVGSKTAYNAMLLFGGNIIAAVLGVIALIIVSRKLGPAQFGILATFNALWSSVVVLTDFGLGISAVKFISENLQGNKPLASTYMKVIFKMELLCGILIAGIGLPLSSQIAELLGGEHLLLAVRLGLVAGMFISATGFLSPFLTSFRRFKTLVTMNILSATFRLTGVVLLMSAAILTSANAMIVTTGIFAIIFFLGLLVIPRQLLMLKTTEDQWAATKKVLSFTKWIFFSTLAVLSFGRIDIFMLSRFKGSTEVGLYAAAVQLTNFFPILFGAISNAVLPTVSTYKTRQDFIRYFRKSTTAVILLAIVLIPVFFISGPAIRLIFGANYEGTIGVFQLIYPGYLIALIGTPWNLVLYAIEKPHVATAINYLQLAIMLVIYFVLIPPLGRYGAALAFTAGQVIGLILSYIYIRRIIHRLPT